jgi:hypothetical protein
MPSPSFTAKRLIARLSVLVTLVASVTAVASLALPAAASASKSQIAMIQDGGHLQADPARTLAKFRSLGATTVRVVMFWALIAPDSTRSKEPHFNATDPNAYPAGGWVPYDTIVRDAKADGMTIDFTVAGGSPVWADGPQIASGYRNPHDAWKPNAALYGQFMKAVGTRYNGHFTPKRQSSALPRVSFWALWNEPNFGQDLGPQAIDGSTVPIAPMMYRNLANAGYKSLQQTGHGHDRILIGEFAARGLSGPVTQSHPQGLPGNAGQTKPLQFIRALYCVDSTYHALSGSAAKTVGCPTTAAASRRFRAQNPVLFNSSGVGDHPYPDNGSPVNDGKGTDLAAFPDLPNLEHELDRLNTMYGSHKHFSIYNDEYGYITDPPVPPGTHHYVSPATAAYYINWAEYLSWKSPRIASTMQYLLVDPAATQVPYNGFASGLYFSNGKPKATLNGYEMPVYMPQTKLQANQSAEVWGEARPAQFGGLDSHQTQAVQIQFQAGGHGAYKTIATIHSNGYFDVHEEFSSGGNLRLAYTYPSSDAFLPVGIAGSTILSRTVKISA